MTFEITIKGLPKTPNQRMHWRVKAIETKKWRTASYEACLQQKRPYNAFEKVRLTLIRASSRQCDIDNIVSSFKAIIDGLRDAKVISDDNPNVVKEIVPIWEKAHKNAGYVKVIVQEI